MYFETLQALPQSTYEGFAGVSTNAEIGASHLLINAML